MGGGYAQHATHACVPRNMAVSIPDGVSDEDASSIHLVATALNAVRRGAFQLSEHIAVAGLGLVGQFYLPVGTHFGMLCHGLGPIAHAP